MRWSLKDNNSTKAGVIGILMTFVLFIAATTVGVCTYPFVNFYLINSTIPTKDQAKDIFNGMKDNAYSILLSYVVGSILSVVVMVAMRYGRYIATFIAQLQQIVIYNALLYFSVWILYKVNSTPGTTVFTILPYFIYMVAAVLTLEISAFFGLAGKVAYGFVSLGAIIGCCIGILRAVDLTYFPLSGEIVINKALGVAFARALVDTTFFVGACALMAGCIARSKIGSTFLWHVVGWVLSIGLACAFATTAQIVDESHIDAIMSSSTARWVVASLMAIITVLLAAAVFSPIRKMAKAAAAPQPAAAANKRATLQAQPVVPGRVVAAPIAANAVILV